MSGGIGLVRLGGASRPSVRPVRATTANDVFPPRPKPSHDPSSISTRASQWTVGWRGRLPRYFFDTCDGERQVRDEAGIDLASPQDIGREAAIFLQGLGVAEMLGGRSRVFTVKVRREDGGCVYRGTAKLDIR